MLINGVTDLHVHGAPSLVPRHANDADTVLANTQAGVELSVLKAHEGSTAERALLVGDGAAGGVVLNSPVGGANPEAVEIAARFGARVVWMPTISAPAHRRASRSPELDVHRGLSFRQVDLLEGDSLLPDWHEVLEVVAHYDLLLASGHLTCREAIILFRAARAAGVTRLLLNHPVMPFIGWDVGLVPDLLELEAHLELSILPDRLVAGRGPTSQAIAEDYPTDLLVFGSDLGHADHPTLSEALPEWLAELVRGVGEARTEKIMTDNGRSLVLP